MADGFDQILAAFDPDVQRLASSTRDLIRTVDPDVIETPWVQQKVVGYGIGPRKMSEHYCYIAFHRDHVNLGFNQGADLPDPDKLLAGPGKMLRHLQIRDTATLDDPALRALLVAARQRRLETRPGG